MSAHVFHEIYLHFNWHIASDLPPMKADIESEAHQFIQDRCIKTKGVRFHGIGGTPTHIHLVVSIEPFVCLSTLVGDLKGACARETNAHAQRQVLRWQRGFGVVSFAKKHLEGVLGYVSRQVEHHSTGKLKDALERYTAEAGENA